MRALLFSLVCILLGCTSHRDFADLDWVFPADEDPTSIRYGEADGYRYIFSFQMMRFYGGYTGERLREQIRTGVDTLGSSGPLWDCSNERFACLRTQHFVFAIPRRELSRGMSYMAEGQRFDVVGCHDDACRVADIRTSLVGALINGSPSAANANAYFTFDSSLGVTSIEFGPGATGEAARRSLLLDERGILAPSAS